MRKKHFVLFFTLLLGAFSSQAQLQKVGAPSITNFSRVDYRAGTQNWAIEQDSRGVVYFANNKGVLEFDGTNWQTFPMPNSTIVRSLTFDTSGRMYIGAQDEFGFMAINEKGQNQYTSLTHLVPEEFSSFEDVWKIFAFPEGIFFCSKKVIFHLHQEEIKVIQPKGTRFENFFELEGKIYAQDQKEGLFLIKNDQLQAVKGGNIFPNERIVALLPYKEGQALLFTFSQGIFVMNEQGIQAFPAEANTFLKNHQSYCAIELHDGRYAVGTPQNGLLLINRNGTSDIHINNKKGLQNNTVLGVRQDRQQNLWLALDNGIDYAEIHSPFSRIRGEEGITGTGYASIVHDGRLYIGTNQGLFSTAWTNKKSSIEIQPFQPVKNSLGQVWNINKVGENVIIGQHKGASYLNDNELTSFYDNQGSWKFMALQTNPEYALQGTYSGLFLYRDNNFTAKKSAYDTTTNANWQLVGKIEGFEESARVFEEDQDGMIWISHSYKGLFKLQLDLNTLSVKESKLYASSNGLKGTLSINVVKIRKDLFFTTPNGIFKYDKVTDLFSPYEEFDDFFGKKKNYHRLIEDRMGNIWFSIDNEFGVLKVEEEGVFNKYKTFYFNHIQDDLVDGFEHIYTYDENNVFIGTKKGFVHYSPLKDKKMAFPCEVLIRKVVSITEKDSIVFYGDTKEDTELKTIDFPYAMNDFRFSFSAPYYEKISYLRYRFKLEGFEDKWSDWSNKTEKEYTNLASGEYAFHVQAKNAYGELSKEAVYNFQITPPIYWSWYAKLAYFILSILGLKFLINYISKKEEKKTEEFKKEQTQKLELKEAEFKKEVEKSEGEIIKLRNEKLNIDIKHKNSQLAAATMHLVQKSEILMKIKTDLTNIQSLANPDLKKKIKQITRTIESDIQLDDNWEQFESYFDQVHENFFKRLRRKFPELTPKDQKLCAYLRMNLTTKEIAPLLNISVRGVEISRYRLRKKLNLNSEVNLVAFIMEV